VSYTVGDGGSSGSSISDSKFDSCEDFTCNFIGPVILISLGSTIGLVIIILIYCWYCRRSKNGPLQTNSKFVGATKYKTNKHASFDITHFKSGIWSSRYSQLRLWHGPNYFPLSFDSQSFKVTGFGSDNVGKFTIDGIYSDKTNRMGLIQKYQLGSDVPSKNLGHEVIIQLAWNSKTCQFEGQWYVQTKEYCEDGNFELKFNEEPQLWTFSTIH
jgi:hypothetical protein